MLADAIKVNLIIKEIIITSGGKKPSALHWAKTHHSGAPSCKDPRLLEERKLKLKGFLSLRSKHIGKHATTISSPCGARGPGSSL